MKKKILLIIDNLGSGGAQNQLTLLAVGLKKKGIEVSVFYYYPQDFFLDRLLKEGIQTYYVEKKSKFGFKVILELLFFVKRENITHIISFLPTPNFYSIVVKLLTRNKQKHIISYRSSTNFLTIKPVQLWINKWVNKKSDFIVFNSQHERKNWISKMPAIQNKSLTIYNAINFNQYVPKGKKELNLKLLCVGSIGPDKNGLCVIDGLKKYLLKNKRKISLTWVGQKILNVPTRKIYLDAMYQKIDEIGLHDSWTWVKPLKDLSNIYFEHDALVLASKTEGLPNVACEALACGLPIIISDVLDHPILCDNENNGFLFDPNNPDSLCEAIEKFYDLDIITYLNMSSNASAFALKTFSHEDYVNSFENLCID